MNQVVECPSSILRSIFSYAYFSFLSPISVAYCKKDGKYVRNPNRYQKKVAVLLHILIILICCLTSQQVFKAKERVAFWTLLLTTTSWEAYLISTMHTVWFKQEEILFLINQIRITCSRLRQNGFMMIPRHLIVLLKILLPSISLAHAVGIIVSHSYTHQKHDAWDWTNVSISEDDEILLTGASPYGNIFGLILATISCASVIYTTFGYSILLGVSLTLWLTIDGFVKGLKTRTIDLKNVEIVLDIMVDMSKTFEACSGAFDILFAQEGLALIPSLAVQFYSIFVGTRGSLFLFVINSILFSSILMLAAGCNAKLTSVQTWVYLAMSSRNDTIPHLTDEPLRFRVSLLMNQINEKHFGISGIFFMITYEFVGGVCGLVITYTLVLSQLQG